MVMMMRNNVFTAIGICRQRSQYKRERNFVIKHQFMKQIEKHLDKQLTPGNVTTSSGVMPYNVTKKEETKREMLCLVLLSYI